MRLVAQQSVGPVARRPGPGNIPRLLGLPVDLGRLPDSRFGMLNQLLQGNRVVVAQVEYFVRCSRVVGGRQNTVDNVRDVGVVPAARAIPEHGDWLTFSDQAAELVEEILSQEERALELLESVSGV